MLRTFVITLVTLMTGLAAHAAEPLTADDINGATPTPIQGEERNAGILKAQVLLDRAGFSPGSIDARGGENFTKALTAFQRAQQLTESGALDDATWQALASGHADDPVVANYIIKAEDLKGPFVAEIPKDYRKMAALEFLGYRGPREAISETFHMDEELLAALNPDADFSAEGSTILVASVGPKPGAKKPQVAKVVVDKTEASVRAFAQDGTLIAYYPASVGSTAKPAPTGSFEVRAVAMNPTYTYDPDFKFNGQKADKAVEVAPGPNGPVGAVWIALTAKTYGIHGTSEPDKVSKTASHGCIRLTNWDAIALAKMVSKGTAVELH